MIHQIDPEHIRLSQEHAKIAEKHGRQLDARGKELQQLKGLEAVGKKISECGQITLKHATASYKYAKAGESASGEKATQCFEGALREHAKATEAYTKGIQIFAEVAQAHVEASKEKLSNAQEYLTSSPPDNTEQR